MSHGGDRTDMTTDKPHLIYTMNGTEKKKQKNHSSSRNECLEKLDAKTKNLKLAEVFSLPNFQIRDPSSIEPAMV